ncbi:MAG TPA: tRNA (adenosine(37)-N6)-threonylcarbamoyltransferase complex transferase subunit TsaD [Elusimicrobiota bacterium]|nr:tRNA (adenosine(37)-N6)-threonylcarbamoyltransferase complex transferase subunit TsaD [Elusimicrobiota bacterium]
MNILGIETSCDETAAAIVRDGRVVLRSAVASQMAAHRPFRGVVPELASRAHVERLNGVIEEASGRQSIPFEAIAVTTGPGLIGSLLVGVVAARTWGWALGKPVVGINHLEAHLFAGLVEHRELRPPFLGLIVSGGHTELVIFRGYGRYQRLGATRDDAAGEAFDKVANLVRLPFPGGPSVDRAARRGDAAAIAFPRAWIPGTWDFSFSGLKTAVRNYVASIPERQLRASVPDICASFQESVVDVLVQKTLDAAHAHRLSSIVVGGGVAANRRLRSAFRSAGADRGLNVFLPDLQFCTDNAAMVAAAGYYKFTRSPKRWRSKLSVDANLAVADWRLS